MTKTILTLIALGLGGVASAQPPVTVYGSNAPTVSVSYADLNIASERGVQTLQGRVRAAASDLCLEPVWADLSVSTARTTCYRAAVHDGFAQINRLASEKMAGKSSLSSAILISAR